MPDPVSASLTGRGLRRAGGWWSGAWQASLSARSLAWLGATSRSFAAGSLFFSLRGVDPRPLRPDDPRLSASGRLLALIYVSLRRWLGYGSLGRLSRRLGISVGASVLVGGGWVALLGAVYLGLGVGGLVEGREGPAGWAALAAVGAVSVVAALALAGPGRDARRGRLRAPLAALLLLGFVGAWLAAATPALTLAMVAVGGVIVGAAVFAYRPEFLLPLLAVFPWLDWVVRRAVGGPLGAAWDEVVIMGSVAALAVAVVVTCRWRASTVPQAVPFFALFVVAVGSVVVMRVGPEVGLFALRVTLQPVLFFFLGYLLPRDRRIVGWTVTLFLGASLLLALHGVYQYATHAPMPASWVDARETAIGTRAYSILENPNGLGAFLLMGTLVGVALALSRLSGRVRIGAAATTCVLAAGLAVTFSRGAWIGLGVGLLAMAALSNRRLLAGLLAGGAAALLFAPRPFVDRLTFAFSSAYINQSLSAGRLYIWRAELYRLAEHPWFGVGLGTFGGSSSFIFGFSRLWIDNFYLQLALEGGVLLLAAFLWLLLRTGKGLVAAHRRVRDPLFHALTAGVFGAVVAVAVANVTASVWETVAVGAGFWFLAGLAASSDDAHLTRLPRVRDMAVRLPTEAAAAAVPMRPGPVSGASVPQDRP